MRVTFSYPDLDAFRWRVLGDDDGEPDETNVIIAVTEVDDPTSRTFQIMGLANNQTIHIQVSVMTAGLWSDWVDSTNPVSFTPPPTPSVASSIPTT